MAAEGLGLVSILGSGLSIAQGYRSIMDSKSHHVAELEHARQLHEDELKIARSHHIEDISTARAIARNDLDKMITQQKRELLINTYSNLESHFVQLDADLVNALKESERDMYDQRNQQLNTLILSSTVMLAALTTLLMQGIIPQTAEPILVTLFSFSCGLSFALQTLCVVLCIETLRLASSYMIDRAKALHELLKEGRTATRHTFDHLRAGDFLNRPGNANFINGTPTSNAKSGGGNFTKGLHFQGDSKAAAAAGGGAYSSAGGGLGRVEEEEEGLWEENIFDNDKQRVLDEWKNIEIKHHAIMKARYDVNDKFALENASFESFWRKHCKKHSERAGLLFYFGSILMLIGTILWSYMNFTKVFNSYTAALACGIPIALSIPLGLLMKRMLSSEFDLAREQLKSCVDELNAQDWAENVSLIHGDGDDDGDDNDIELGMHKRNADAEGLRGTNAYRAGTQVAPLGGNDDIHILKQMDHVYLESHSATSSPKRAGAGQGQGQGQGQDRHSPTHANQQPSQPASSSFAFPDNNPRQLQTSAAASAAAAATAPKPQSQSQASNSHSSQHPYAANRNLRVDV